ncbi:hypothetical protein B0T21DRAFT_349425 [Apiosordaria backusii]|uniref:Uncharacterized protein n=1 Tax=Apiosordaria backusii TaxID=314023 RepID=A0AA40BEH1_9PEZI|nr:hypothetical protein B0T21DRAFT_349425 [Apiosordaria backusii]
MTDSTREAAQKQINNMKFQDSGPIIAICDLLFDAVRALFPSRFPEVDPLSEGFNTLTGTLNRLDGNAGEIREDVRSMMNVVQGPAPVPQESIVKLLSDVKTEMQRNTEAVLEQTKQSKHLTTVLQGLATREDIENLKTDIQALVTREDVMSKADQMIQLLTEMRDAFSKLPEPVSAFPKAPGTGMHGPPSD